MNLYFRFFLILVLSWFKPKISMDNPLITQRRRVLLNDMDINLHMNNGRYLTLLDLAVVETLIRSGFFKAIRAIGGHIVLGGALITYRKQLGLFEKYSLNMQYIGSNSAWHLFDFSFINEKGQVCAKGVIKGGAVKRGSGIIPSSKVWESFSKLGLGTVNPPELPEYAVKWLESEESLVSAPR